MISWFSIIRMSGKLLAGNCLRSLEDVFGDVTVQALEAESIGPSLRSYRFGAALIGRCRSMRPRQVMAARADLLEAPVPSFGTRFVALSRTTGKVAAVRSPVRTRRSRSCR